MSKFALVILASILFSLQVFGQAASVQWGLSADQNPTITIGNVSGQAQSLTNMQVYYTSVGLQRSSPAGTAGTWPDETAENSTRYMTFAVSPKPSYSFRVDTVLFSIFVNSGSGMYVNIYYSTDPTFATKTLIGSAINLSTTVPTSPNFVRTPGVVVPIDQTFYLRIYPWYHTSGGTTGKYLIVDSLVISGETSGGTDPAIVLSTTSLNNFGPVISGNSSASQSYSVSGVNLLSDIGIKALPGFEVSSDNITFSDSIGIAQSGGIVGDTLIYARFLPSSAIGTMSEQIIHTSNGATTKTLDVNGVAISTEPTMQSAITFGAVTGNSIVVNFSGGNGNSRILVARQAGDVSWFPVDGSGVGSNSNYSAAADLGSGNKIVFNDTGSSITVTGLAVGTQYYFAICEYNVNTNNSQNYLTVSPGTGNQTTLAVAGLAVNLSIVSFGNVRINTSVVEKSYSLSGIYLTPESGTVTVTTPDSFQVSLTSGSNFASSLEVAYTGGVLDTTIYIRFEPSALLLYSDTIRNEGGGAAAVNVLVNGRGVSQSAVFESQPVGFASCGTGTTGGAGASPIVITTAQQFANIMKSHEGGTTPLIVQVSGTLISDSDEVSIKHTANISVIGLGADAKLQGFGLKIWDAQNVIVRNITFSDCSAGEGDCLSIEECINVWIDHCSFTDSPSSDPSGNTHDGALDVKKESYYVTLSWNHFMNHRKTCLLGHSTSETGDTIMKVTYVHNWFSGTYSRHPRTRYAKAHILNNYYSGIGDYGIGSTCGAQIFVEGNYFENTSLPTLISQINDPGETLSGDPAGYLKASSNYLVNSGSIVENTGGYDFNPSDYYIYSIDNEQSVKDIVMVGAGAGIIQDSISSSVPYRQPKPTTFELKQNYPNPFNPKTKISFFVGTYGHTSLRIYDILGREIITLVNQIETPGNHTVEWDGRSSAGQKVGSGIYFYRLKTESGFTKTQKMLMLK
jgi:pectate lyase